MNPQESLKDFMQSYKEASTKPMGKKMEPGKPGSKIKVIADYLTSKLPDIYKNDIKVKASVGNGTYTQVPWIGFFFRPLTTSATKGHYPVVLFKADMSGLYMSYILAAGRTRGAGNAKALAELRDNASNFRKNSAESYPAGFSHTPGIDLKCGKSTVAVGYEAGSIVHKYYPIDEVDLDELSDDLNKLIKEYVKNLRNVKSYNNRTFGGTIDQVLASIASKRFMILAGGTGTGKTRSAKLAATSIAGISNIEVVAVGADWTDNRPLLGFRNLLAEGGKTYVAPHALRIILKAIDNPAKPHFLILDEMNLSHVERYFADFLSSMESKEPLKLHDSAETLYTEDGITVPGKIAYPNNLFVIGTVNIDETTYMFSPKVLDRAHVIEFKVTWDEIANGLEGAVPSELPELRPAQVDEFMRVSHLTEKALPEEDHELLTEVLEDLHAALEGTRFVFAHRTARECLNFIASAKALAKADIVEARNTIDLIDLAILQKALPKLNGASGTLSKVLEELIKVSDKHDLELCKEKLESMGRQLKADQFVSFIQ
jgi:5-methylcytosine-specific restriction protein B